MYDNCSNKIHWIIDSGVSHHMTTLSRILKRVRKIGNPFHVVTTTRDEILVEKNGRCEIIHEH